MMKKVTLYLAFVMSGLVLPFALQAQDPQYTQFYANQPMLNPALTGAGEGPRVSMNYRAQWVAIPGSFRQIAFAYDQPFFIGKSLHGAGFMIQNDRAGEGNLSKMDIMGQYSFAIQMGRRGSEHFLRFGIAGGIQQASIDFSKLRFSDQIDLEKGFIRATTEVPFGKARFTPDFQTGLAWYNKNAWVSFSMHHLTEPSKQVFINPSTTQNTQLPRRYCATAGINIPIGPYADKERIIVSPALLFMKQRDFNQLNLGTYVTIKPIVFGLWLRTNFKNFNKDFMTSDMLAGLVGFKQGIFSIGYSYDYTISRLTNGISGGSHEIALIVEFEQPRHIRFKHKSMPCPRF